ncbi:MAG: NDP-sugar synthase [Candidatus Eremiobacteraeota bacterium]|nr:NDP-sugar synthase [Candidatus Eremiobacteraeota bacterium]MBV9700252.1 NDP-sugar synthase [Candidatus Eremiobacteraeota bacterium]
MKAMILAGGLSTRLYPLTKMVPKPLVPVAGAPNAIHLLRYLKAYGFDEVAINVHYLADDIVATLGDGSQFGVKLQYSYEPELLGSAGGVKKIESFFDDEPFLVIGCDEVTDMRLDRLFDFHRERAAIATIGLVECAEVDQYGVVVLDDASKIVGFQEKPAKGTERSRLANTGVYAFSPEIFAHIPAGKFYDFGNQVFPSLQAAAERFYGFRATGAYWADIGTPKEYRRASYDVIRGLVRIPQSSPNGIDPSARLGEGVEISGAVRLGADVSVGDGVSIQGPCILDDGVNVETGARLERSIVWRGATVGARAELRDTVVGTRYAVAAETILENALVADG